MLRGLLGLGPPPVRIRPVHQLRPAAEGDATAWIAEGDDPQFLVEGPFCRGLWELRFVAGAREQSQYARMQLYLAEHGEFTEGQSLRFGRMAGAESEHRLRFYLPFHAASVRFDPMDSPGVFTLGPMLAVRRSLVARAIGQALSLTTRSPRRFRDRAVRGLRLVLRRNGRALRAELAGLAAPPPANDYPRWLRRRLAIRGRLYRPRPEEGLLSLVTTAYDTPPAFLAEAVESVLSQRFDRFEWVLLDNGSREPGTLAALRAAVRDPRVRLHRLETNVGIIRGMRFVLERATGRYILPMDSDDVIDPDCLSIMADHIQSHEYPPLLYSDEDKLRGRERGEAFFKPGWDPVLLRNCCYIAHLCAIDRERALALGAYTDPRAEGCHDWDTFLRFVRAGCGAVHVPEVLYSWRMHAQSTAANVDSKAYIFDSHHHVLSAHLAASGVSDRFTVELSPVFPGTPDWWIRRRRIAPRPLELCVFVDDAERAADTLPRVLASTDAYAPAHCWLIARGPRATPAALRRLVSALGPAAAGHVTLDIAEGVGIDALTRLIAGSLLIGPPPPLVALLSESVVPDGDEWPWEAQGLLECFPDAVVVGGRVLDRHRRILSAGECFGYGDFCGSPDAGRRAEDPGYFGLALKQRSASAVSASFCVVEPHFLARVLEGPASAESDLSLLGAWLGAHAKQEGARVIYSPFLVAVTAQEPWPGTEGKAARRRFLATHGNLTPDRRYYHPMLSLDHGRAFTPSPSAK